MSDQQRSIDLARLCGWEVKQQGGVTWIKDMPNISLYDQVFFDLAWEVLNWVAGLNGDITGATFQKLPIWMEFDRWWSNKDLFLAQMPPADAQRAILDKIWELANEAGMI